MIINGFYGKHQIEKNSMYKEFIIFQVENQY